MPASAPWRAASWALVGALLLAALAVGLAAPAGGADQLAPRTDNRGPRGLAVLFTWLAEAGLASASIEPLSWLPRDVATVVLAAPTESELDADEVEVLRRFVEGGGTLVYLASREVPQPALHRWLRLEPGATPPLPALERGDTAARVLVPGGALQGLATLRVRAQRMIVLHREGAVPVAEWGALWWWPAGAGEVWVGAGPDLAESGSLGQADNARFWGALAARGPMVFEERHHLRGSAPHPPLNLAATLLQLGLVGLAFVVARGSRLGPAREPPPRVHRSALEYVAAMARLTRAARVEPELLDALRARARRLVQEHLACPPALAWEDAVALVGARDAAAARSMVGLAGARNFLDASRHLARLERRLLGLE
jgi:hypothetical protein